MLRYKTRNLFKFILMIGCCMSLFVACENTNLDLAAEAGLDAIKAVTLTDEQVKVLAFKAAQKSDSKNRVAAQNSRYGARLYKLVGNTHDSDGYTFNFKVYQSDKINAFAMADGTIRIYSGLMDMMNDEELLFVIGHEMGHVVKKHIKKKMMVAYATSAVRKGVASQYNLAGEIASSGLGALAQMFINAQFSQEEEHQADDYGIQYLHAKGKKTDAAVSALRKLVTLGKDHSFLSSHPAPDKRADRLQLKIDNPETMDDPTLFEQLIIWIKSFFV